MNIHGVNMKIFGQDKLGREGGQVHSKVGIFLRGAGARFGQGWLPNPLQPPLSTCEDTRGSIHTKVSADKTPNLE